MAENEERTSMPDSMADMSSYQRWEHGMLEDIGHDTDAIIKMESGKKMTESYDNGFLTGMLANKGVDPSLIAMLDNNKGAFGGDGGLLFLLFLVILMGGNLGGYGGGNVDRTVINEGNFNQLMNAVSQSGQNQSAAIQTLANNLNVDVSQITSALAGVDKALAVSNGDLKSAIQSCCCNIRTEIQATANATQLEIERGFNAIQNQNSQIAFAAQDNANRNAQSILNALTQQTAMIQSEFCTLRNREDAATIQNLRDKLAEQRDAANTQLILTALANKDTIATTIQGTLDTTAGTWSGTGTGSLS